MKFYTKDKSNYIVFSRGNKKLKETEKIRYFIFNLPAVKTCPFATPSCAKACYARKAERLYPQARASREHNYEMTLLDYFDHLLALAIVSEYKKAVKAGKRLIVRLHESGDIYSPEYASKLLRAVKAVKRYHSGVTFYAYTKSIQHVLAAGYQYSTDHHLIKFYFSEWHDTGASDKALAIAENWPVYTAAESKKFEALPKLNQCDCLNCSTCGKCFNPFNHNNLICEIH